MSFNDYVIIKVKDHSSNKEKILSKIGENNYQYHHPEITDHYSNVSNTDWDSGRIFDWYNYSFSQADKEIIYKVIQNHPTSHKGARINNSWFNQYEPNSGSEHPFHVHDEVDLVLIYFVELNHLDLRTILIDPLTKEEVIPEVHEGDLLFFSSNILHRSPSNNTDTRKTVISFNIDLIF